MSEHSAKIPLKRVYDAPDPGDGKRVPVEEKCG